MKKIKLLAAALVLCASSAVSYYVGYNAQNNKHCKAACHMSDLIRCYEDHLKNGEIEDYGCFEELEGNFLYDDALDDGMPLNLKEYVWCY